MPRPLLPQKVTHVILHCSASLWGDLGAINAWHRQRGFGFAGGTYCGYHHLILNGCRSYAHAKEERPVAADDGLVVPARPERYWGCHALGYNDRSIGICLIGVDRFTEKQLAAARALVTATRGFYGIPVERVLGHCETPLSGGKSCPNLDMVAFRASLGA